MTPLVLVTHPAHTNNQRISSHKGQDDLLGADLLPVAPGSVGDVPATQGQHDPAPGLLLCPFREGANMPVHRAGHQHLPQLEADVLHQGEGTGGEAHAKQHNSSNIHTFLYNNKYQRIGTRL